MRTYENGYKMKKMQAYIYDGKNVIKKSLPVPHIRPNDILVKVDKVSLCGSDFHIFQNDEWARETITPDIVIGHEGCGLVEKIGADVSGFQLGDYVALESHYACPPCEREGKTADHCPHYGIIGIHGTRNGTEDHRIDGVFSEYIAVPQYCCHKVSRKIREKVSPSLMEPAGNSWEIIRFLRQRGLPENIAIHGCGPHGLNLQLFARHAGIKNVVAFETAPNRIDFAKKFGAAHHVINPKETTGEVIKKLTKSQGFDVAIDMAGNIAVVEVCENQVRDGGMVILFGLPRHETNVVHGENFARIIFNNEEIQMERQGKKFLFRGFTGRTEETWEELIHALEESEFLRDKLAFPLQFIGNLNELENFIRNRPEHFLKIGMRGFNPFPSLLSGG